MIDQVVISEQHLRILFNKSWKSRYRHYITFLSQTKRVVKFNTDWCRRPTPHEPLPDVRVRLEFSLRYDREDTQRMMPAISFRIEHESFIYKSLGNIEHHLLRIIKLKSTFFADHPLKSEQGGVYGSRMKYDPSYIKDGEEEVDQADAEEAKEEATQDTEQFLVEMFTKADEDNHGTLDQEEFTHMVLNSGLGFNANDIELMRKACDANDEGVIVYREFIPVALDMITARRALEYAVKLVEKNREEAEASASKRVVDNGMLRASVRDDLAAINDGSNLVERMAFLQWLNNLELALSPDEVDFILQTLNAMEDDNTVNVIEIVEAHEAVFLDALLKHTLSKSASDVELYLTHLFKKADAEKSGELSRAAVEEVLNNSPRIKLTSIQVHVVINSIKTPVVQYQHFARQVAYMVYKMFDKETLKQRKNEIPRSAISLGGRSRERIVKNMRDKFREFDVDDDGFLSSLEFHKLLADTSLSLSEKEIDLFMTEADLDQDGQISLDEFMKFAFETLLHLARDAALKTQLGK